MSKAAAYAEKVIAAKKSFEECSSVVYTPSSAMIALVCFTLAIVIGCGLMAIVISVAFATGALPPDSRFARIMVILTEKRAAPAASKEKDEAKKNN